jgi:hypothetical protein
MAMKKKKLCILIAICTIITLIPSISVTTLAGTVVDIPSSKIISNNNDKTFYPDEKPVLSEFKFNVLGKTSFLMQQLLIKLGFINQTESEFTTTDYSAPENWLVLPEANDMAVDIFYLYPTVYYKLSPDDAMMCDINNPLMRTNAQSAFHYQATAFETVGNIYAPYYRQPDIATSLSLSEKDRSALLSGITKADVFAAFDYYIEHYNNGRPFVLAGHSLGSNMLLLLPSEYMGEHPDVYARMVAAYVIGYSVTEDYLAANPHLKFAENSNDTGVIISFNTQASTTEGKNPILLNGGLVINPISWTRDSTTATAAQNLGSIILNPDRTVDLDENGNFLRVMNFADATADSKSGVLICSTVDVDKFTPEKTLFPKGIFNTYDYAFYFYNIRENATNRTKKFQDNQSYHKQSSNFNLPKL